MKDISLKVGETYETREGKLVRITKENTKTKFAWRFEGSNGEIYKRNGASGFFMQKPVDIVKVSDRKLYASFEEVIRHTLAA